MVRHIVMFKLKDNSPQSLEKAKEVLLSMKGNVSLLRGIEVGIDFLRSERSYDVVLITDFDTREDLALYQNQWDRTHQIGDPGGDQQVEPKGIVMHFPLPPVQRA